MNSNTIKIGGASGFWGDSAVGTQQLLQVPGLNYLTYDYLAELTLAIMAGMQMKNPDHGYALDFVQLMQRTLPEAKAKGIRVIANAGGLNPQGCAQALRAALGDTLPDLKIAVVHGDQAQDALATARESGQTFHDQHSGQPMPPFLLTANAYLGAFPVAAALEAGADVVITGRIVDSAMTLGALIHEFGWAPNDLDQLAQGSLAGHMIECGAQATGGLFTDWQDVPNWANIGYPVLEVEPDGSFELTKPEGTGGLVSKPVAIEQLLYEIHDPARYALPDVICDFTQVQIESTGDQRVRVHGALGHPPTDSYKVSCTYPDGFRCIGLLSVVGFDAEAKARRTAQAIFERCEQILVKQGLAPFSRTYFEIIGAETELGPHRKSSLGHEAMLRLVVTHKDKKAASLFSREIAPAGTSYAPGTSGNFGMGRPNVSPLVKLFSTFLPKTALVPRVQINGEDLDYQEPVHPQTSPGRPSQTPYESPASEKSESQPSNQKSEAIKFSAAPELYGKSLLAIAHGRSGDKGNTANIGLIARSDPHWPLLKQLITADSVKHYLAHLGPITVTVYELPQLRALNVVVEHALDGGGMASMRNDPLGKGLAQVLLTFPIQ